MIRLVYILMALAVTTQSFSQRSDFDSIDFKEADSIALSKKSMDLENMPYLVHTLTEHLDTDVEKFRAIYIWVCTNISNDYGMYAKNMRKRHRFRNDSLRLNEWNTEFKKEVFRKLIKRKRTLCTGYAYLLKELCDLANLNCKMIHGFGKTATTEIENFNAPNHSWNAIELNGKWYLSDPTWASGMVDPDSHKFEFIYNEGYFLTSPELFAINHFPLESKWLLLEDESLSFKEFIEAPILYGEAYKRFSSFMLPETMHSEIKKHESLTFQYKVVQPFKQDQINFMIDSGSLTRTVKPSSMHLEGNSLTLEYQFDSTGFFDVHLMLGDEYVSTYTVRVKG